MNDVEFWNSVYQSDRDYRRINHKQISKILELSDVENGKALDIGSGTGHLSRELYHRGFSVTGVDMSSEAIKIAESLSKYVDYINLDLENDDLEELEGNNFDLITCKLVFAFIDKRNEFLLRVKSLLSKNGVFAIITPTLEQVEENKRSIAVDYNDTLSLLKEYFDSVEHYQENGLTVFIAKQPK